MKRLCLSAAAFLVSATSSIAQGVVITTPIDLSGADSLVISDADYTVRSDITLRGNSTLIIRRSTFAHLSDYSGQYRLEAYDNAKVIVEDSTVRGNAWMQWTFYDDSELQLTNVKNAQSQIWSGFTGRTKATLRGVTRFWGTVGNFATMDIDQTTEAFLENRFDPGAIVDESFPSAVGSTPYTFPNGNDRGVTTRMTMANIGSVRWGITCVPQTNITVSDTNSLVVGFKLLPTFSDLHGVFNDLKAKHYEDQTWTTAGASLRLRNTTTGPWYPTAEGNNALTVRDSELADIQYNWDTATVTISDSTIGYLRGREFVRLTVERSSISGDVVAGDDSLITLVDSAVGGKVITEKNGLIETTQTVGLGTGFLLGPAGTLTTDRTQVISGRMSIKGSYAGTASYNPYLWTNLATTPLQGRHTYRVELRYRILEAPSRGFEVLFFSGKAAATGNNLRSLTINGRAGDSGTERLEVQLGNYDDYRAIFNVIGTGAIVADDIRITDLDTQQVVAFEGADTPVVVERR